MPFQRFVETGRVALVADGPSKGKLVSIVDVIDQTRVLVDGPETGVPRGQIRLNQLHLTKFAIKFPFTGSTRVVRKAWKANDITKKWSESMWAKKLANKEKRAALTDFDRFKLRKMKTRRNKIRTQTYHVLRKTACRDGTLFGKKKMVKNGDKPIQKKTAGGKKAPAAKPKAAPKKK